MTTYADTAPSGREDPLYQQGSAHLQKGEWQQAIQAFEELQTKYPDSALVTRALETSRLRASVDTGRRVRGRRNTLRIGPILLRLIVIALIGYLVYTGGQLLVGRVQPMIAAAKETQRLEQLLVEGAALLEGGDWVAAEERFSAALEIENDNPQATEGLAVIARERQIIALYEQATDLDDAGEDEAAMEAYMALAELRPGYRDIVSRMDAIQKAQSVAQLFDEANAAYEAGSELEAVAAYKALRDRNLAYEQTLVEDRLYGLYLNLGTGIVEQNPPQLQDLPTALGYFSEALALRPRSQEAGLERQLLKLFLEGQTAYYEERWSQASAALRVVYDTRPDYLGDTVLKLLYESYVRSGDDYRNAGDSYLAYEQYSKANDLPVEDKAFVEGRLFYVRPLLTPTATPTPTPTPRPEYAGPPATPRPLTVYKNKIVFLADYPNRGEIWVMDPDGQNRQRLGRNSTLLAQFEALQDRERYDPEEDRFAFAQAPSPLEARQQIFLTLPAAQRTADRWFTRLTYLDGDCSAPVWSPDGNWIAFVSSAVDSDDIWIVQIDGNYGQPLTPNPWEWDRHPSWSPEGDKIVFWSNRSGLMQLYSMNADGSEVTNISNSTWDEYDPVWVK